MLIKNNKIIVRKCNQETYKKLIDAGYERFMLDGKQLVIPFHVFDEDDLFDNLKSLDIKFYAVPLDKENAFALNLNSGRVLASFDILERADQHVDSSTFIDTMTLIKDISENVEGFENNTYQKLVEELRYLTKSPLSTYISTSVDLLENKLSETVRTSNIDRLRTELNKKGITQLFTDTYNNFLKCCLDDFVHKTLADSYRDADLAFWYRGITNTSKEQERIDSLDI